MTLERFKEKMIAKVSSYLGSEVSVSEQKVLKNNSLEKNGIIIRSNDSRNISPVIYLEPLYRLYQAGESSMDECVLQVVHQYREADVSGIQSFISDEFMSWDFVKAHVYPVLISTKQNWDFLKTAVSRCLLDLSVIYQVRMEAPDGRVYSMKLNYIMLKQLGVTEKEVYESAIRNMKNDGYRFYNLEDAFALFMPDKTAVKPAVRLDDNNMYVLVNRDMQYGAAGLLNGDLLREATGGRDFYVIPSSVHEVIFVSAKCGIDSDELTAMVRQVNESEVAEAERLSDHVYYYNGSTGEIQLIA